MSRSAANYTGRSTAKNERASESVLTNLCTLHVEELAVANDVNITVHNHFVHLLGEDDVLDSLFPLYISLTLLDLRSVLVVVEVVHQFTNNENSVTMCQGGAFCFGHISLIAGQFSISGFGIIRHVESKASILRVIAFVMYFCNITTNSIGCCAFFVVTQFEGFFTSCCNIDGFRSRSFALLEDGDRCIGLRLDQTCSVVLFVVLDGGLNAYFVTKCCFVSR